MEKFKNIFGSNETNQSEETGIIDDVYSFIFLQSCSDSFFKYFFIHFI
jgi:hypothetical protein